MLTKSTVGGSWGRAVGWNAGAISAPMIAGDIHLDYKPATGLIGVIVGIRPEDGTSWITPGRITHGFYCYTSGAPMAVPIESNVVQGAPFSYASGDTLSIVRSGGNVSYLHNGTSVHASSATSFGLVHAASCLYAAGDSIT